MDAVQPAGNGAVAMDGAFNFYVSGSGVLRITGADRTDFIQRQSTNDLVKLQADTHLATVLTNPAARILDVLRVIEWDPDSYGVVTLPGRGPETAAFLKRRIFFNDQVRLEDLGETYAVIDVDDRSSGADGLFADGPVPASSLARVEIGAADGLILGLDDPLGTGYLLIAPRGQLDDVRTALVTAGGRESSPEETERRRIVRGILGGLFKAR